VLAFEGCFLEAPAPPFFPFAFFRVPPPFFPPSFRSATSLCCSFRCRVLFPVMRAFLHRLFLPSFWRSFFASPVVPSLYRPPCDPAFILVFSFLIYSAFTPLLTRRMSLFANQTCLIVSRPLLSTKRGFPRKVDGPPHRGPGGRTSLLGETTSTIER